ncbi:MAG TPA: hypothetical protein PLG66_18460, partial [Calditrichia bacterium]|nr:hypothetical protein [Calditrichia bacterium]
PSFTAKRRFRDGVYHILVENPNGISRGVKKITVNGTEIPGNVIPPLGPGEHRVRVILEGDV